MHHVQGSVLTLGGDPFETAAEHSDTVAQERAIGGVVNVAFHDRSSYIMRMMSRP
jgi:hypothetical protein